MKPQERVALVSGAGRGIGLACARALLEAGNRVVASDIAAPDPALFPAADQERLMAVALNVTDTEEAARLLAFVREHWGPVGILINNAGISPKKADGSSAKLLEVSREEWDKVMAVNLTAVLELSRLVCPQMQELGWGRLVHMTSLAGRARSRVAGPSYICSKSGLIALSRCMANEWGPYGITSNCIAPGRILTDMVLQAGEAVNQAYADVTPLKRLGSPDEVAATAAFLASEGAGFINGAVVDVNGGVFMG